MKKRLLSVLLAFVLAFVLAFGFVSPALAEGVTTPAGHVKFGSVVGKNGILSIETTIDVLNYWNVNITEYPSLYTVEGGTLTLVRSFTADNCTCGYIINPNSDGVTPRYLAYISLNFTDAEYLAFDFTADYVLKIPAGIYKDAAGNLIGQQSVTFSGPDIEVIRYEMTFVGKLYFGLMDYLYSLNKIPVLNTLVMEFNNTMRAFFYNYKIPLFKPVTAV